MEDRLNICFVAHFAYKALSGQDDGHIGGVERQTSLMAKWLASRGHRVSVVVWGDGKDGHESIDGVNIVRLCRRDAGLPVLRFFAPRWSSLNRALRVADADIYYQNCAEYVTGQVALWARMNKRRFVFSVASDPECLSRPPILHSFRERFLFELGRKWADKVIVQSRYQQNLLRNETGIRATVLPMPSEKPTTNKQAGQPDNLSRLENVLWIGRIAPVKRVELLLDIARDSQSIKFDVVGGVDQDAEYAHSMMQRASGVPNVVMHGAVNFEDVGKHYQAASVLCCTSEFEGFPNTFLEAWSWGVPVISTVEPDNLFSRFGIGIKCDGKDDMVRVLQSLHENPDQLRVMSQNARDYFRDHHSKEKAMPAFESMFMDVVQRPERVHDERSERSP
jgi:glycosyltransferase involved in cell wall biosynthesis